jgi:pimeloyl-ACP methyl ester carboxylesterase
MWVGLFVFAVLPVAGLAVSQGAAASPRAGLIRVEQHLVPDARVRPHPLLMTLGGPVYCMQLENLARHLGASLVCADFGKNGYEGVGGRAARLEDWGDPPYLAAAARLPDALRQSGVKISELAVVGVSYSGYANAELVATHPEMRPDALVVVDSYLDLTARFRALPLGHETRKELVTALGGTPDTLPDLFAARSPSNHLDGLAAAVRAGMRFVDVWSVSDGERREFRGATCSRTANATWLAALASKLGRPVTGYITRMRHAHALWDRGMGLMQLALGPNDGKPLHAHTVTFRPAAPAPPESYCAAVPGA